MKRITAAAVAKTKTDKIKQKTERANGINRCVLSFYNAPARYYRAGAFCIYNYRFNSCLQLNP